MSTKAPFGVVARITAIPSVRPVTMPVELKDTTLVGGLSDQVKVAFFTRFPCVSRATALSGSDSPAISRTLSARI